MNRLIRERSWLVIIRWIQSIIESSSANLNHDKLLELHASFGFGVWLLADLSQHKMEILQELLILLEFNFKLCIQPQLCRHLDFANFKMTISVESHFNSSITKSSMIWRDISQWSKTNPAGNKISKTFAYEFLNSLRCMIQQDANLHGNLVHQRHRSFS